VPPEDGRLTPETCRGLQHNKVIVKVKVYYVCCVIVNVNRYLRQAPLYSLIPSPKDHF
jgi:hypothetical protein